MPNKSKAPFGSKAEFVRANPTIAAPQLVKLAKKQGLTISSGHVYNIRAEDKKKQSAAPPNPADSRSKAASSANDLPRLDAQFRTLVIRIGLDRAEQIFSDLKSTLSRTP